MSVADMETKLPAAEATPARRGTVRSVLRERPSAIVGLAVVVFFILVAIFGPMLSPYGVHEKIGTPFTPPSLSHPLGLDDAGIDMVTLLMQGARVSLVVGFAASLIAILIGALVGVTAGYFGGKSDVALMRVTDYFLVVPDLVLMIVIASIWGQKLIYIIIVIGALLWTGTARVLRAQVKSIRERVYVRRSLALGGSNGHTIVQHVLPQVSPLIVANAVLLIAVAIFDETALAYLGLGDPTAISWGKLIKNASEAAAVSAGAWWAIVPPGLCVATVILACTLIGQALEDALNPRLKASYLAARGFRIRRLREDEP
ncbi:MAG TPA: ABC transporter permease [Actinomycetota bacterium]